MCQRFPDGSFSTASQDNASEGSKISILKQCTDHVEQQETAKHQYDNEAEAFTIQHTGQVNNMGQQNTKMQYWSSDK